jgi:hypothetical protein
MEEPIDNLTTQSGSGDEAQTEKPVVVSAGVPACGYCHTLQLLQTEEVV